MNFTNSPFERMMRQKRLGTIATIPHFAGTAGKGGYMTHQCRKKFPPGFCVMFAFRIVRLVGV